jgi:hypothetical protein
MENSSSLKASAEESDHFPNLSTNVKRNQVITDHVSNARTAIKENSRHYVRSKNNNEINNIPYEESKPRMSMNYMPLDNTVAVKNVSF